MSGLRVRIVASLADVDPKRWDACANPEASIESLNSPPATSPDITESLSQGERYNPFISHGFLFALEASGSTGGRSGWSPAHVLVENEAGMLVAGAPSYVKSHSQGEYVFDHAWADAYARAGGRYYPKI